MRDPGPAGRELGNRLRAARLSLGWTVALLAKKAKVSPTTLRMWERGEVAHPHLATLRRIARALRVEWADLSPAVGSPPQAGKSGKLPENSTVFATLPVLRNAHGRPVSLGDDSAGDVAPAADDKGSFPRQDLPTPRPGVRLPLSDDGAELPTAAMDQRRDFDRRTNRLVDQVRWNRPELFVRWSEDELDELYSTVGVGGELNEQGVVEAAGAMNRRRETLRQVQVLLETHLAEDVRNLIANLYRQVCVPSPEKK